MILLLDNYDSFVFNLDRYLQQLGKSTLVVRSDSITIDTIARSNFEAIVISPGPKAPDQAGCCLEAIRRLHEQVPILGVCLGHQCIVQAFGGRIIRSPRPMHGYSALIHHVDSGLFQTIPSPISVGRYHSLMADPELMPSCLRVTSRSEDNVIMSVEHDRLPIVGVQFHPESILSEHGHQLLKNFMQIAKLEYTSNEVSSEISQT